MGFHTFVPVAPKGHNFGDISDKRLSEKYIKENIEQYLNRFPWKFANIYLNESWFQKYRCMVVFIGN